jgi:hypothetical protein
MPPGVPNKTNIPIPPAGTAVARRKQPCYALFYYFIKFIIEQIPYKAGKTRGILRDLQANQRLADSPNPQQVVGQVRYRDFPKASVFETVLVYIDFH